VCHDQPSSTRDSEIQSHKSDGLAQYCVNLSQCFNSILQQAVHNSIDLSQLPSLTKHF